MTASQTISVKILEVMKLNGCDVRTALDVVLGQGTFEKLAGEVYDALRATATTPAAAGMVQ